MRKVKYKQKGSPISKVVFCVFLYFYSGEHTGELENEDLKVSG